MSSDFKPLLKVESSAHSSANNKLAEKRAAIKEKKANLYKELYYRKVRAFDLQGAALSGVKYVSLASLTPDMSYLQLHVLLQDAFDIQFVLSQLTPRQFETLFPIIKDYNGHKFECKDYWTTKEYLSTLDPDVPIRGDIDEFLWNYYNNDIIGFSIKMYLCVDRLKKLNGEKSMMEEFADMFGLPTYTVDRENNLIKNNKTGEVFESAPPETTKIKDISSSKEEF